VRIAILTLLAGCNGLLGLDDVQLSPDAEVGSCTPPAFDQHRYISISGAPGFTWQDARTTCEHFGFDLAVLDEGDSAELAAEGTGATTPFWLGVSYGAGAWEAIDGCEPKLAWAPVEPLTQRLGDCVLVAIAGMRSIPCTNMMTGGSMINALCETPRPNATCQMQATQREYQVIPGIANHDGAVSACSTVGMHLLEIDSTDELDYVLANVASGLQSFWLGATFAGSSWVSPTSCPAVFAWNSVNQPGADLCVIYKNGGMETDTCGTGGAQHDIVCERNH
jgi:hypothetical protein